MNLKEESVLFIPAAKTSRYTITKKKKERKEGLQNQSREFSSNTTACSKKNTKIK